MTTFRMTATPRRVLAALVAALLLPACSGENPFVISTLDPTTAVTVSRAKTPLVFYRDESGRAAFSRDFVHLGPLEVNRAGSYRYFLWLGIWSTLQDTPADATRDGFEAIVIFADGEPLLLPLEGWTPDAIGASEPVYVKPVASSSDAYYEVTLDQIRLIANAKDVRLQSTGPAGRDYEPWDGQASAQASMRAFIDSVSY